jgi:hypothetical protein
MTFDLKRMLESKKALRSKLAGCPLAEKLDMLDALRERALAFRKAGEVMHHTVVHEAPEKYRTEQKTVAHFNMEPHRSVS